MVLNDVSIIDEHSPEDMEIVAISTVLHELAHILDRPFAEISRLPPPEAFTELWLSDVRKYHEIFPQVLNGVSQ